MINGHDLGRLIELAFDYVSAETEQQTHQVYDQAVKLAAETATFNRWLKLIDHIKAWNNSHEHNYPMSWASALQFLSSGQAEVEPTASEEPVSKITFDLTKLIEQAIPQVTGAVDSRLLLQWLARNSGTEQMVTIDLVVGPINDKAQITGPTPAHLQGRINDVITFSDDSELRIHVLSPRGSHDDLASAAYYELLPAISNIQRKENKTDLKNPES